MSDKMSYKKLVMKRNIKNLSDFMSDKRQTIRGESDIKDFVGFAYYQTKFDIKIPYALFEIQPDTGRISKTCSFDHQKTVKGMP